MCHPSPVIGQNEFNENSFFMTFHCYPCNLHVYSFRSQLFPLNSYSHTNSASSHSQTERRKSLVGAIDQISIDQRVYLGIGTDSQRNEETKTDWIVRFQMHQQAQCLVPLEHCYEIRKTIYV
jgi:hypothetical protein